MPANLNRASLARGFSPSHVSGAGSQGPIQSCKDIQHVITQSDQADGTTRQPMWHEFIVGGRYHIGAWAGILSGRLQLDRRTIRLLNQSLWLKSLTTRQRCLA
ncbi:hypothetical protein CSKR_113841 [Clonorchis sinensis]|uniref:Uncharacterized protein n=1 Tax=Clonorchis sinensis TaxID=79923 RepID=A0A3R7CGY9_CLOSI|nr:hypothetical protein CSKR_113841 [Clonorchis sinensis]